MVYNSGGGSTDSDCNPVGKNINQPKTGDSGTVGGAVADT